MATAKKGMFNNRGPVDVRKVLSGKDGALFAEDGTLLATVETFQTKVSVTNAKYQPLGDAQEHEVFTGYNVTLTFTETVISDERFIQRLHARLELPRLHQRPGRNLPAHELSPVRPQR